MYDVQLIAKYIIHRHALPINNPKLQQILYFVQAEFLVSMNRACFTDDIEAWDHGPVVPAVHSQYMIFGNTNIPDQGHDGFELITKHDKNHLDSIGGTT